MFFAGAELKRKLKKGMDGIDRRGVILVGVRVEALLNGALGKWRERGVKRREKFMYTYIYMYARQEVGLA